MEVTISQAQQLMRKAISAQIAAIKAGKKLNHAPMYLHSSPGLGKSAVTKQIANDMEIGFVDLRLASMEQSDVCGIPYVSHAGAADEAMKFSIPSWFPTQAKVDAGEMPEYGILFFDELSNAPIGVQHSAYRLILDREVQTGVKLPDGWMIVAAGNNKNDKTGAKGVAPALANRFAAHLHIRPSHEEFINYAAKNGLAKEVIGYLLYKPSAIYNFDPAKADLAFATPRSWEATSNLLNMGFDEEQLTVMMSGCVGEAMTTDFLAYRKYYSRLPNFHDIMEGKIEYKVKKDDMGIVFAVTSSLIQLFIENIPKNAKDTKAVTRIKNLEKVLTQMDDDYIVMVYKTIKSTTSDGDINMLVMNTMDTYKRIMPYVKVTG